MSEAEERKLVVSVSGGKDSTSMWLYLREQGREFEPVFMDTGWEAPQTYDYIDSLEHKLGLPITRIQGPRQMVELIIHKKMFPSRRFRYCTQFLKVFPFLEWVGDREIDNAVGIRAEESHARSQLEEWGEMQEAPNIHVWRPLLKWTLDEIIAIHKRHDLTPNPLYLHGAERVGCWPCIFERKGDIRLVASMDPERIDLIRELERIVQEGQRKRLEARGETYESLGYKLPTWFSMKIDGSLKSKHVPIDEAVKWSRTAWGAKQYELFTDDNRGCLRWGLCDAR